MTCEKCGEVKRTLVVRVPGKFDSEEYWCPVCNGGYVPPPKLVWENRVRLGGRYARYGKFLLVVQPYVRDLWEWYLHCGYSPCRNSGDLLLPLLAAQQAAEAALLGILRGEA